MTQSDDTGIAAAERLGVNLTHPERDLYAPDGISKAAIVAYYATVADRMLPHLGRRPLSLVRCPQGANGHCFFQKHGSAGFPPEFQTVPIIEQDGDTADYMYVDDLAGLVAGVQMSVLEFHIWGSHVDDLERPDRIVFDIDPDEGLAFAEVRRAASDIRARLQDLELESFPMLTGGKGIHVVTPLTPGAEWPVVKQFCRGVAAMLAEAEPQRFTTNIRKASRSGRLFIDYLRNERGATAIAPFSTRARKGAPCAVPVGWDELGSIDRANLFSLQAAAERAEGDDPWTGYFELSQEITEGALAQLPAASD